MKKLTRTLCLVLVLAMCFSLCAFGANYSKYTDAAAAAASDYAEAVDVVVGLGIIAGTTETTLGLDGTLTRAQAAKILTYLTAGENVAKAVNSSTTDTGFVDCTGHWASGYIAYCVAKGYLAGVGEGKFDPNGALTGYAFEKMLLNALGYGLKDVVSLNGLQIASSVENSYTGANWAINVAVDAEKVGLTKGITGVDFGKAITRAVAMQLVFNALQNWDSAAANVKYALAAQYQIKAVTTGADAQGVPNKVWKVYDAKSATTYKQDAKGKDIETAKTVATPALSYTTKTTYGKIAAALGCEKVADKVELTVVTDGIAAAAVSVDKTAATEVGGNGVKVEVYKTAADKYTVVVVNEYVKTLAKTDIVAAVAAKPNADAVPAYIKLGGTLTFDTADFKEKDVVIYTKGSTDGVNKDKVVSVVKAESVVGKVSATAAAYFKVDGVKLELAAVNTKTIGTDDGYKVQPSDTAKDYTYYKDAYGYVVLAEEGVAAPVEKNYTFVVKSAAAAAKAGTTGTTLFDAVDGAAAQAQAQIIDLQTGELKIVNIAVAKSELDKKFYYAGKDGKAGSVAVVDSTAVLTAKSVYEYTVLDDGSYVFGDAAYAGVAVSVEKAKATGVAGKVMNSATVLNVVEYTEDAKTKEVTGATVTTTTGIANFPEKKADYTGAIVVDAKGVVTSITVVKAKAAAVASVNYAIYVGAGEFDGKNNNYKFIVKGETVEFASADLTALGLKAGDVVSYKLTDGKIDKAADVAKQTAYKAGQTVSGVDLTYVAVGTDVYYFAKAGVEAYVLQTAPEVTATAVTPEAAASMVGGDYTVDLYGNATDGIAFIVVKPVV